MTEVARWWEDSGYSIEDEKARFEARGLDFTLDEKLFEEQETVVFRGRLRRGNARCEAFVVYPAGYAAGEQPSVYAIGLSLDEHWRPSDGLLCLDQSVFGEKTPLTGAEAVESAEELWRLSVEDPQKLRELSPVTPEPIAPWFHYETSSAVYLLDVDVPEEGEGWFRLKVQSTTPVRGALDQWGFGLQGEGDLLDVAAANNHFAERERLVGFWRRIAEPPEGLSPEDVFGWARSNHGDLLVHAHEFAKYQRQITGKQPPSLVAFVFPDRGPRWNQTHDAWLFLRVDGYGTPSLPRAVEFDQDNFWVRQPQLRGLAEKKVVVVGVGALGSQIALLLARAGAGEFTLIDNDNVTPGNTVRHALSLSQVGLGKAEAVRAEVHRANPFCEAQAITWLFGSSAAGPPSTLELAQAYREENQRVADELESAHLIVEASTVSSTGYLVSSIADQAQVPVVHAAVSAGAWGARILLQRHGQSGCLECLALHQKHPQEGTVVPHWSEDPNENPVVEKGCGQTTFTGPGFELAAAATAGARVVVQALLDGDGYPSPDFDLVTWFFRDGDQAQPKAQYTKLPRHSACDSCHG